MANQNTKQGDERLENVEEALSKTELWIENNQKTLWIILIVLLVIAFGIFGITKYNQKRNQEAMNQIFPQEISFESRLPKPLTSPHIMWKTRTMPPL